MTLKDVKYDIGCVVRAKTEYLNDNKTESVGTIAGIIIDNDDNIIRYKLRFQPDDCEKKQGCTGSFGYVKQEKIIEVVNLQEME